MYDACTVHLWSWSLILVHACRYDACIYDAAEILSPTDGRTYEPTEKAILGEGLQSITEYYRVLESTIEYYRVLECIKEYFRVLQGYTGYCRVLKNITEYYRVYRVLQIVTEYYRVLQSTADYYRVLASHRNHQNFLRWSSAAFHFSRHSLSSLSEKVERSQTCNISCLGSQFV